MYIYILYLSKRLKNTINCRLCVLSLVTKTWELSPNFTGDAWMTDIKQQKSNVWPNWRVSCAERVSATLRLHWFKAHICQFKSLLYVQSDTTCTIPKCSLIHDELTCWSHSISFSQCMHESSERTIVRVTISYNYFEKRLRSNWDQSYIEEYRLIIIMQYRIGH